MSVNRYAFVVLFVVLAGCGATVIGPGHRGLVFDPHHGGLHHEVLDVGSYRVGHSAHIVDYDVTYSTRTEPMTVITVEGLQIEVKLSVIYRPIVAELYELESEIGRNYYDEVVGPELRSAAREEFARHSYLELTGDGTKLEGVIEDDTRRRIAGKHVDVVAVALESVVLPPDLANATHERALAEQNAVREKAARERAALEEAQTWAHEKLELEHEVERRQLQRAAAGQ